jgi:hypothetical protein
MVCLCRRKKCCKLRRGDRGNDEKYGAVKRPRGAAAKGSKEFTHVQNLRRELIKKALMASVGGSTSAMSVGDVTIASEMKESRYARWGQAVQVYVATKLFRYVQFINREEEVMYGSGIQKIVCKECCIPENEQLDFWTNVGRDMVEEVLRRKRQTLATSFRSQFESK